MAGGGDGSGGGEEGVVERSPADLFGSDDAQALRLGEQEMPFNRIAARAGPGRPKGSANRRTVAMREVFLRLHRHPMLWMGEVLSRSVAELAHELGCDPIEALDVQRKVAADLMPYLESKMPTEVVVPAGAGLPMLVVGDVGGIVRAARQVAGDGSMAIDDDVIEALEKHEQDQGRDGSGE